MDQTLATKPYTPQAGMHRPRLGFLGVGWIGRHRLQSLIASNLVEIAAVADTSDENRRQACELAPRALSVSGLEDLLAMDLDGLVIATPSAQHADQACAALAAGLPVFCQKPLALSADSTRRVIAAAQKADRLLGVDLSYRYLNGLADMRQMVAEGRIGSVFAADLVFHNAYGPDKAWYYDKREAGGGCVVDLGTHLVDLLMTVLNRPAVLDVRSHLLAGGQPLNGRRRVEDYAVVQLTLQDGVIVQLACSWHLQAGCPALIRAAFYGTAGGLCIRNVDGSFFSFLAEHYQGTACHVLAPPNEDWWGAAVVHWARLLVTGASYDPGVEDLIAVAQVLDRIYAADSSA